MQDQLDLEEAELLEIQMSGSEAFKATFKLDTPQEAANALCYAMLLMFEDWAPRLSEDQISETLEHMKQSVLANWRFRREAEATNQT